LETKLPHLKVQPRGSVQLGVGGTGVEGGCEIAIIKKGSAADKAGLMVEDLIISFNGKRGRKEGESLDFDRLVELLKEHNEGDKVPLLIRRDGREQIIHVTLEGWKAGS
jgi:serine protease Do